MTFTFIATLDAKPPYRRRSWRSLLAAGISALSIISPARCLAEPLRAPTALVDDDGPVARVPADGPSIGEQSSSRTPRSDSRDLVAIDGLPSIRATFDASDRLTGIVADRLGTVVAYEYGEPGTVTVRLSNGTALRIAPMSGGLVSETLTDRQGSTLFEAIFKGRGLSALWRPVSLGLVADELGLGPDWARSSRISRDRSGLLTVSGADGTPRLRVRRVGSIHDVAPVEVGFDPEGNPLFCEIDATPLAVGGDTTIPMRIILTAKGVQVEAPLAPRTALIAFRALHGNGSTFFEARSNPAEASRSPLLLYVCDSATTCATSGNVTTCTTTNYWCDDDGGGAGGGGGGTGGDGSSGGGGDTDANGVCYYPGNNVFGNQILRSKVNIAITSAVQKLQNQSCLNVFQDFQTATGATIAQALQSYLQSIGSPNMTPSEYLSQVVRYYRGESGTCAAGPIEAYNTPQGSLVVKVCPSFVSLGETMGADYLIHEMLHTLGLGENPPSSGDIQSQVVARCGN